MIVASQPFNIAHSASQTSWCESWENPLVSLLSIHSSTLVAGIILASFSPVTLWKGNIKWDLKNSNRSKCVDDVTSHTTSSSWETYFIVHFLTIRKSNNKVTKRYYQIPHHLFLGHHRHIQQTKSIGKSCIFKKLRYRSCSSLSRFIANVTKDCVSSSNKLLDLGHCQNNAALVVTVAVWLISTPAGLWSRVYGLWHVTGARMPASSSIVASHLETTRKRSERYLPFSTWKSISFRLLSGIWST